MPQDWEYRFYLMPESTKYVDTLPGLTEFAFSQQMPPGHTQTENFDEAMLTEFPINQNSSPELYNFDNGFQYDLDTTATYEGDLIPDIDRAASVENIAAAAGPFHVKNPTLATIPKNPTVVFPSPPLLLGRPVNGKGVPLETDVRTTEILGKILSLKYWEDGFNSLPFVQVTTKRAFLPILKNKKSIGTKQTLKQSPAGLRTIANPGAPMTADVTISVNEAAKTAMLKPFPICIAPDKVAIAQRSTRYVYGPWMTNVDMIMFRGKVEYEQDENLVPENFLIPTNFGAFGDFKLRQLSGLAGLNLAAQAKANAIDDFSLFAQEQGSITIQGAPAIKRIGDSLYGIRNVTDVKVNVSNSTLKTSYSFKTISPRFGRNNADIEKKLTKISNKVKQIKLV